MRLGDKPLHLDPSLHDASLRNGRRIPGFWDHFFWSQMRRDLEKFRRGHHFSRTPDRFHNRYAAVGGVVALLRASGASKGAP
jgi:hypothetical protein